MIGHSVEHIFHLYYTLSIRLVKKKTSVFKSCVWEFVSGSALAACVHLKNRQLLVSRSHGSEQILTCQESGRSQRMILGQ